MDCATGEKVKVHKVRVTKRCQHLFHSTHGNGLVILSPGFSWIFLVNSHSKWVEAHIIQNIIASVTNEMLRSRLPPMDFQILS